MRLLQFLSPSHEAVADLMCTTAGEVALLSARGELCRSGGPGSRRVSAYSVALYLDVDMEDVLDALAHL